MLFLRSLSVSLPAVETAGASQRPPCDASTPLRRSASCGGEEETEDAPAATRRAAVPAVGPCLGSYGGARGGGGVGGSVGAEGGVSCSGAVSYERGTPVGGAVKRVRSTRDDAVLRLEGLLDCYARTGGAVAMDVEGHAPSLQG